MIPALVFYGFFLASQSFHHSNQLLSFGSHAKCLTIFRLLKAHLYSHSTSAPPGRGGTIYCPAKNYHSSMSYSFNFLYNVLSLMPRSDDASFLLPLCFFSALIISSFSLSMILSDSSIFSCW